MTNLDTLLSKSTFRINKCQHVSQIIEKSGIVKAKMIEAGVYKAKLSLGQHNLILSLHSSDDSLRIYGEDRTLFVEGNDITYTSLEHKKFLLSVLDYLLSEG